MFVGVAILLDINVYKVYNDNIFPLQWKFFLITEAF